MNCKVFQTLPEEAIMIRTKVFIEEQGFKNEFDAIDNIATHLLLSNVSGPMGTCRIFYSDERQCYVVGRIAVLKEYRGKDLGSRILKETEKEVLRQNGNKVELLAQVRVSSFYQKNGYHSLEEYHMDEGCPHVWMQKEL